MAARPHKNISWTWDETYTLPENFYLAYQRGAGPRYRQLAQRFLEDDTYFGPLCRSDNVLPGQHAYSHVNALCSAMQAYLTDGSQKHLAAAATASASSRRRATPPAAGVPTKASANPAPTNSPKTLTTTHNSFETPCGAYGHFKITRYLMRVTGDTPYGDSMETVLYNTILGARPIRPDGVSFYYADYNIDAAQSRLRPEVALLLRHLPAAHRRLRHQLLPPQSARHQRQPLRALAHHLATGNRTRLPHPAHPIPRQRRHQHAPHPLASGALHHRPPHPRLGGQQTTVKSTAARRRHLHPGTWANLDRTWKDGDRVELSLDMPLRLAPIDPQHPKR